MAQLDCRNLTLGYEGNTVISDLSFSVDGGDYLCIVGENGSGKSTLMKTILKLKSPVSGQVLTGGGLTRSDIGYLPQHTQVQKDFPASVREVVRSGCLSRSGLRPFYNKKEKNMAEKAMQMLAIAPLAKLCYRDLSGGQQQRALLARAICSAKKILLLDEPVAGLDPQAARQMYELTAKLNDDGMTVIMISHDISAAVKYASHILHLGNQTSLFYGTKADYLKSDAGRVYARSGGEPS